MPRRSKRSLDKALTDLERADGEVVGLDAVYEWSKHLERKRPEDALPPDDYLPPGTEWADAVQETLAGAADKSPELEPLSPVEIYGVFFMDDETVKRVKANLNARIENETDESALRF